MTRIDILKGALVMAYHNTFCYSENYAMMKPKEGCEGKWKQEKEKAEILEQMIKEEEVKINRNMEVGQGGTAIRQPEKGTRNMSEGSYESEGRNIDLLNQALGDIELSKGEERSLLWLAGWERSTVKDVISVFARAENERQMESTQNEEKPQWVSQMKK